MLFYSDVNVWQRNPIMYIRVVHVILQRKIIVRLDECISGNWIILKDTCYREYLILLLY